MTVLYAVVVAVALLAVLVAMLFLAYREMAEDLPCRKDHRRSRSHERKRV